MAAKLCDWARRHSRELILAALVLAVFLRACRFGFVHWDDAHFILRNRALHSLNWANLRQILLPAGGDPSEWLYIPVTYLSYALEIAFFGLRPQPMHGTNVVLHLANTLLVYRLALQVYRDREVAFWAALLMAAHPLQAESVAWIFGRKDLLATLFALLAVHAWLAYARLRRRRHYAVALLLYVLALLAKPAVIVLPGILWLVSAYESENLARKDVIRLIPFGLVAAGLLLLQSHLAPQRAPAPAGAIFIRSLYIPHVLQGWAQRIFLLARPSPFYSLRAACNPRHISLAAYLLCLGYAGLVGYALQRRRKQVWFGLAFFAIGMLPALAVTAGLGGYVYHDFVTADHYGYLPIAGLFLTLSWAGCRWARRNRRVRVALAIWVAAAVFLCTCQVGIWRNAETLWQYVAARDPTCETAHFNLGNHYYRKNAYALAVQHYVAAVAAFPSTTAYTNLGLALSRLGQFDTAVTALQRALSLDPATLDARLQLGYAYLQLNRLQDAHAELRILTEAAPAYAQAHYLSGLVLLRLGRGSEARQAFRQALTLQPGHQQARHCLAQLAAAEPATPHE